MSMQQFILKKKPVAIVLSLKDTSQSWYPSKLAKVSSASYVYVVNSLARLQEAGWVRFEERGRLKLVFLTERGLQAAAALDELVRKTGPSAAGASPGAPSRPAAEPVPSQPPAHAKADAEGAKEKETPKT
ncbi:MAG: hypothetical protein V1728_06350 [Candidatus Micrarchaeota archaeon]